MIQNPYSDLIVNFVGSGSEDETITLAPGESRRLQFAIHAQDALERDYDLTAVITADDNTADPLIDTTTIHVRVLSAFEIKVSNPIVDPVTGARTYSITNTGQLISDLNISVLDPETGQPARVYMSPTINHARLDTDRSLTFKLIPLFDERDVVQNTAGTISNSFPSAVAATPGTIPAEIVFSGAGKGQTEPSNQKRPNSIAVPKTVEMIYPSKSSNISSVVFGFIHGSIPVRIRNLLCLSANGLRNSLVGGVDSADCTEKYSGVESSPLNIEVFPDLIARIIKGEQVWYIA